MPGCSSPIINQKFQNAKNGASGLSSSKGTSFVELNQKSANVINLKIDNVNATENSIDNNKTVNKIGNVHFVSYGIKYQIKYNYSM